MAAEVAEYTLFIGANDQGVDMWYVTGTDRN